MIPPTDLYEQAIESEFILMMLKQAEQKSGDQAESHSILVISSSEASNHTQQYALAVARVSVLVVRLIFWAEDCSVCNLCTFPIPQKMRGTVKSSSEVASDFHALILHWSILVYSALSSGSFLPSLLARHRYLWKHPLEHSKTTFSSVIF